MAMAISKSTTSAPVAISSAASDMTPSVWKAKTQSSLAQTAGYKIQNIPSVLQHILSSDEDKLKVQNIFPA